LSLRRNAWEPVQIVFQVYPRPSKVVRIAKDHYSVERGGFEPVNFGLGAEGIEDRTKARLWQAAWKVSNLLAQLAKLFEPDESGFIWSRAAERVVGVRRVGFLVRDQVEQPVDCFLLSGECNG
jgi:hypothetical protein